MEYQQIQEMSEVRLASPTAGDHWHEMFSHIALVVKVYPGYVVLSRKTEPVNDHQYQIDFSELTLATMEEFRTIVEFGDVHEGRYPVTDDSWPVIDWPENASDLTSIPLGDVKVIRYLPRQPLVTKTLYHVINPTAARTGMVKEALFSVIIEPEYIAHPEKSPELRKFIDILFIDQSKWKYPEVNPLEQKYNYVNCTWKDGDFSKHITESTLNAEAIKITRLSTVNDQEQDSKILILSTWL